MVSDTSTMENSTVIPLKTNKQMKKLGIELPYDPAIPLLDIYPEKIIIQKNTCIPTFIQHYLQQLRHRNNLDGHWQMGGWRNCSTYKQWNII